MRYIVFTSIIVAIIVAILYVRNIAGLNTPEHKLQEQLAKFNDIIANEDVDELTLTIYFSSPYIKRDIYWNTDQLIDYIEMHGRGLYSFPRAKEIISWDTFSIYVPRIILREYVDLLQQIRPEIIKIVDEPDGVNSVLDAHIYYIFKYNEMPILDVAMWSGSKNGLPKWDGRWLNIYVNGVEIEADKAFYDVIMPFLPERFADQLEHYITGTLPDYYVDALARD